MKHRFLASVLTAAAAVSLSSAVEVAGQATGASRSAPTGASTRVARLPWGAPDLQGVWTTATVTPMERPAEFAGKEFLTLEEVKAFEARIVNQRDTDNRRTGNADVTAAYNNAWYDYGSLYIPTRRSSLIIDPPDGRMPARTPEGDARAKRAIPLSGIQQFTIVGSWLDRGLWERCITRGVPDVMLPTAYNNNYRIFQTEKHVAILTELIHDARIVPIGGSHVGSGLRQWMGHSVGRWEGDTLVVDTTNFTDKTNFRGSTGTLHVIERFTRTSRDVLTYQATIDDPATFTRPWTFELPVRRLDGLMYEYACHEGNHGLRNMLSASRVAEREQQQK
jgi:hypothetical protein